MSSAESPSDSVRPGTLSAYMGTICDAPVAVADLGVCARLSPLTATVNGVPSLQVSVIAPCATGLDERAPEWTLDAATLLHAATIVAATVNCARTLPAHDELQNASKRAASEKAFGCTMKTPDMVGYIGSCRNHLEQSLAFRIV